MSLALADSRLISLAAGFVDQRSLPVEEARHAVESLSGDAGEGRRALQYGTTPGDDRLRRRLLERVETDERVAPGAYAHLLPRTVVTTGSQQLLYLVSEALIDPGDIVLVESPTYLVYLGVLESLGARIVGVETDDHGLRIDALEATLAGLEVDGVLHRVKLIYTISEHSNPSGVSLGPDRRAALVEAARRWSKTHRIFVLEDSAYRGLTYDGVEPPSVWSHDATGETVVLARTFSKTFSPGLKTGYGILPPALAEAVLRLKGNHDFGSANFNQLLVERLLADGSYDRQIERLVGLYRRKRDVMLEALQDHLGSVEGASWTRPSGGLYIWLTLPEGLDTGLGGPFFQRCVQEGLLYVPGAYAFATDPGPVPRNQARLCFGVPDEAALVEGVGRLARALVGCLDLVA